MKPPKLAEAVVGLLIPPACREHVLGDLHERCTSPRQYIVDALGTLPSVILSQIRRTTDPQVFLMEAFALYISFLTAAWRSDGISFLYEQSGFLRLAIPALVALIAIVLADAYAIPGKQPLHEPFMRAVLAVAFGFLSQAVLLAVNPDLVVPSRTMIFASGMSVLLLSALRMLFPPYGSSSRAAGSGGGAKMPLDEIRQKSQAFKKEVRRGNLSLLAGTLVLAILGWLGLTAQPVGERVAGGVVVAAALYIVYQIYKRGSARAIPPDATSAISPDLYRAQLERRRAALHSIWSWYVGPFLGALMLFALLIALAHPGQPGLWPNVVPFMVLSVIWAFALAKLSERAACKLQTEIDTLDG